MRWRRTSDDGLPFSWVLRVSRSAPAPLVSRVLTWFGVTLFWIVQLSLMLVVGLPLADSILLALLLAVVPALSLAQVPLIGDTEIDRLPAYWGSILTLWLIGTACWFVATRVDGPAALGLVGLPFVALAGWSLGLTAAGMLIILVFRQVAVVAGVRETRLLRQLLPRTPREIRVFVLLSLAAGIGEEFAYRGYVIPALSPILGVVGATVLSTVVFGIMHAYQGWLGMVRTGLMGLILALGFLLSGSLWPPIIAHTLIDLLAGIVLGDRLLSPEGESGVHIHRDLTVEGG